MINLSEIQDILECAESSLRHFEDSRADLVEYDLGVVAADLRDVAGEVDDLAVEIAVALGSP